MNIALCGYMGCGKSTVGKQLANQLGIPIIDLDGYIEKVEGKRISEIFADKGEIYFRKREGELLKELVSKPDGYVLSLGGGTPCYGNNLNVLKEKGGKTVYLKMSVEALTERLFSEKDARPLIIHYTQKKDLKDFVRKHLFERGPVYEQSDLVIKVEGKTPEAIAKEIAGALK